MDLLEIQPENRDRHPWELSRADSVLSLARRYSGRGRYADVGAGDVYFSDRLTESGSQVYAVDTGYPRLDDHPNVAVTKLHTVATIPHATLDLVFLMDVLEHVEDEQAFLAPLLPLLKPGGKFVVTVPAYQHLFSAHDVYLKHFRRYSRGRLVPVLEKAGLRVEESFYFYTLLYFLRLPAVWLEKILPPKAPQGAGDWRRPATDGVTRVLRGILNLDFKINRLLSRCGLRLPGLSIAVVCSKK